MAALPKFKYGNTKINNLFYDGKEIYNVYIDGQIKYHKHMGTPQKNGGCYTKRKTNTKQETVSYHWNRGGFIRHDFIDGEVVAGEGYTFARSAVYEMTCVENKAKAELSHCELATGARANMQGDWGMVTEYGNAYGKVDGSNSLPTQVTTSKTTTVTYYTYDLTCGFDKA